MTVKCYGLRTLLSTFTRLSIHAYIFTYNNEQKLQYWKLEKWWCAYSCVSASTHQVQTLDCGEMKQAVLPSALKSQFGNHLVAVPVHIVG